MMCVARGVFLWSIGVHIFTGVQVRSVVASLYGFSVLVSVSQSSVVYVLRTHRFKSLSELSYSFYFDIGLEYKHRPENRAWSSLATFSTVKCYKLFYDILLDDQCYVLKTSSECPPWQRMLERYVSTNLKWDIVFEKHRYIEIYLSAVCRELTIYIVSLNRPDK